ncbi:polymorphic toxin-type HINT domain-containing protein [Dactylosporangium sp. NBC_01737]|uniref:polymorphic toxin-type HINT domain-containing protein n=1 Tax=Dactylosporangium sp. NBC_01737 TaxID=2975959 RepID=UPI002E110303|nr:polymorphic toxin-type HINT domain-containing protein [Dactylosporangium sp. NBC_01737]
MVLPAAAQPSAWPVPAAPAGTKSVPVTKVPVKAASTSETDTAKPRTPAAVWPAGGEALVSVDTAASGAARSASSSVTAGRGTPGGLPVVVRGSAMSSDARSTQTAPAAPGSVRLAVAGQDVSAKAGVRGVLFTVARADGAAGTSKVALDINYAGFADGYGGDYGGRLGLVRMPVCVLTTPERPECQVQTPVEGASNDPQTRVISADAVDVTQSAVALTSSATSKTAEPKLGDPGPGTVKAGEQSKAAFPDTSGETVAPAASGGTVYALASVAAGPAGNYSETSLSQSAGWAAGSQGGEFTYSYPLQVPPSLGGPSPDLTLQYSSGSVDGKTAFTNPQSSWVGDGWDLNVGYIERPFKPCADDGVPGIADLCWWGAGDNVFTMVFGGKSVRLMRDGNGNWRGEVDDGSRLQLLSTTGLGWGNGDHYNWYWKLTTLDGTEYYFGRNQRFVGDTPQNSTQKVLVHGGNINEPCWTGNVSTSGCYNVYRWNLDYVVDPRQNTMTYFYQKYEGSYGHWNSNSTSNYDITAALKRIEYGTRQGQEGGSNKAPMRVNFEVGIRCDRTDAQQCVGHGEYWPDTPWDQFCVVSAGSCAQKSPTYWTPWRLAVVTTDVWTGTGEQYQEVDRWDMVHTFPALADGSPTQMWLDDIIHTGKDTTSGGTADITLPSTHLSGVQLENLVTNGSLRYRRYRLDRINNGHGGLTKVDYSAPECTIANTSGLPWDQNYRTCYPQYHDGGWDMYQKYRAIRVTDNDLVGGSPPVVTEYAYSLDGTGTTVLWHYDTADAVNGAYRTWSDWAGYSTVTATTDPSGGTQSRTKTLYFRGMHSDFITGGYRNASITDSLGTAMPDWPAYRGIARETSALGSGTTVLTKQITTPQHVQTASRTAPWVMGNISAQRVSTAETRAGTLLTPSNTWRWTKSTYGYDATYGLPTLVNDLGDEAITSDDVCTTTTYAAPNDGEFMVAYASQSLTTDCTTSPPGGNVLSGSQTQYDTLAVGASPTRGLVTRTNVLASVSGTTLNWQKSSSTTYDTTYGRILESFDALDRKTMVAYDPPSGSAPTTVTSTNPAGHVTTTTLSRTRGQTLAVLDPNNRTTITHYDALGRLTKVFQPRNSTPAITYTATTSTVPFADIDGPGSTTVALSGDENHTQISLPFAFTFYGTNYSSAYLSSNGLLSFTDQAADFAATTIPNTTAPNAALYPFWDDLDLNGTAQVFTRTTGTAPNRQFTVEWAEAYLYGRSTRVSFTITLNENDGKITFNYGGIDNDMDRGNAATIGVENATGTAATQYGHHQTLLANDKAITFTPSAQPPSPLPDVQNAYHAYDPVTGEPTWTSTKTLGPNGHQIESFTIYDGLLRPRQTQQPSAGVTGGRVITDTQYDPRGLAVKSSMLWNASAPAGTLQGFNDTNIQLQQRVTYDPLNRPTINAKWAGDAETWHQTNLYDGASVTTIPPAGGIGGTNTVRYDALGRATSLDVYPTGGNPVGTPETTIYTYDRLSQLTSVIDAAGSKYTTAYDLLGRPTSQTDPDTGTTSIKYDEASQITWTIDGRLQKISHEYDPLGRETRRWAGEINTGTKLASFAYDTKAKGALDSATRWVGSDQYIDTIDGYNTLYQPTSTTTTIPMIQGALANTYQTTYSYTEFGDLTSIGYPAGGGLAAETVNYSYTNFGLPNTAAGIDPYVTASTYSEYGELSQRVYGASGIAQMTRNYTYQPDTGRLANITSKLPNPAQAGQFTTVQNDTYTYDHTGDITRILDGTDNQSQCYRYDGQHRLTNAWTTLGTCTPDPTAAAITSSGKYPYWDTYTFDTSGRRTTDIHRTSATDTTTRMFTYPTPGPTAQRVHAATSVAYTGTTTRTDSMTYDNAGNTQQRTINGVVTDFTFNPENQYASATVHASGGDQQTSHLYDATGGLLIRKEPGATTLYAAGQEYKLTGTSTITATRYYNHGGATVAVRTAAGLSWLAADHQASTNLTVNANNGNVQRRWYTPYGADRATQGTWPTDRGFLNKQSNTSTGLLDVGAREYDPNLGVFLSPDPLVQLGDPASLNAYAYAAHSPITYSDPTGLMKSDGGGGPGGIAGSAIVSRSSSNVIARLFKLVGKAAESIRDEDYDYYKNKYGDNWQKKYKEDQERYESGTDEKRYAKKRDAEQIQLDKLQRKQRAEDMAKRTRTAQEEEASEQTEDRGGSEGCDDSGSRHSFDPDTLVQMADGSHKTIEDVVLGDTVTATDPTTSETTAQTVTALHVNVDSDLTDLTVMDDDGQVHKIETTDHHPFWSDTTNNWIDAAKLTPGDRLRTANHHTMIVLKVQSRIAAKVMHDLTVSNVHTYYVVAGSAPVLVHNCDLTITQAQLDLLEPGPYARSGIITTLVDPLPTSITDRVQDLPCHSCNNTRPRARPRRIGDHFPAKAFGIPGRFIYRIFSHCSVCSGDQSFAVQRVLRIGRAHNLGSPEGRFEAFIAEARRHVVP